MIKRRLLASIKTNLDLKKKKIENYVVILKFDLFIQKIWKETIPKLELKDWGNWYCNKYFEIEI